VCAEGGGVKENLKLQNTITLKSVDIGRKNLTFITYPSDSVCLQNLIEIQHGDVKCCVGLMWNEPYVY
jgi:hypothetical protein